MEMPPETNDTVTLAVLVTRLDSVIDNQTQQQITLRELSSAVNRLSVIEERQSADRQSMERAFNAVGEAKGSVKELTTRVEKLEQAQPMQTFTNGVVQKIIGIIVAAVIGALVTMVVVKPAAPTFPANTVQGK